MRRLLVLACASWVLIGCGNSGTDDAVSSTTALARVVGGTPFAVESLGLTFALPETFDSVDDGDLLFLARSTDPPALFSVQGDTPAVVGHAARPGETLTEAEFDGVDAVIVTDANIDRLPPGVSANEFLVANGSQSFSLIMSGATGDLPELWDLFVQSVKVTPAD
jgi:hypothetical protein